MEQAYMDNASATPVRPEVMEAMLPYFDRLFANPSTVYDLGTKVGADVEDSRAKVAELIGAEPERIVFTSSGAEANNMAIKGTAFARRSKGNHVIITGIDHHSVLNAARFLERLDFEVTFLPVDEHGLVDPERLAAAVRPETILASIMHGNREIGTIQPMAEISAVCREHGVPLHSDAVASVGNVPVDVKELGVDMLSLSGVSLGAPKGVGALYTAKNIRLMPLIHGGIQEKGRRAGTENVPGIIGLGKAAELAAEEIPETAQRVQGLRDKLIRGIAGDIEYVKLTGHPAKRLPGHASFCIQAVEGEALVFMLSSFGIYVNTGSACASKALKVSPVLSALNIDPEYIQGSIVFTLNRLNTEEQVDYVLEKLPEAVRRLRSFSPLWRASETA